MNPLDPAPAIVQTQDDGRKHCEDLYRLARSQEARTLDSWVSLGSALAAYRKRVPHGQWTAELDAMGIDRRRAAEAMRLALLPPAQVAELGSVRAAAEFLRGQGEAATAYDEVCGVGGQMSGAPDTQPPQEKSNPGASGGAGRGARETGGTASPPKTHHQPSLPDPEEEKRKLDAKVAAGLREVRRLIDGVNERLAQLLRTEAGPVEQFRRNLRLSGVQLVRVRADVAPGFEDRADAPAVTERVQQLDVLARAIERSVTTREE